MALLDQPFRHESWAQTTPAAAAFALMAGGAAAGLAAPLVMHAPRGPLGTLPLALGYLAWVTGASLLVDDAIRKLGDPIALTYRAVDGSSLVMQARQPLPEPIELACCQAIDLVLRNREAQPETIYVELALLDSKGGKAREQNLSGKRLPESPVQRTTLRFDLPNAADIRVFDEIVVWFHLDESRQGRSANLAIERFDLIQ